jgi:predicted phosphate transport protein (TIGR00153 family)
MARGFRLLPTDQGFFEIFNEAAANIDACMKSLRSLINDADRTRKFEEVRAFEHKGDELTRTIMQRLYSTFVTPFDREDIHALAEELDDVVDDLRDVAERIRMSPDVQVLPEVKQQADLLVQMAGENVAMMNKLSSMKGLRPHLDAIDRLEAEGDAIYRQALRRLFSGEHEPIDALRQKDMVEAMERAFDTIEDISDIVESIVLKHA